MRASQARRASADDRDPLAGRRPARIGRFAGRDHGIDRVALQLADADRLHLGGLAHARLLAQSLGWTDARAGPAHDVGVENGHRRPGAIAGGDLADEQRNVDRGRAGPLAGRVEAEIATLGFDLRFVEGQRGMEIGEIGLESRAIQAAGADIGRSRRVGGDRHGQIHEASEGQAKPVLDRLVNRARRAPRLSSPAILMGCGAAKRRSRRLRRLHSPPPECSKRIGRAEIVDNERFDVRIGLLRCSNSGR